ncbi:hypothetical protein PIB30_051495 [Stylosanthes scabra]|uniref:Uncharacterized protein n=1 Tax=Stylosanthes scabra TaxID=79078 RepID=A0ABU6QHK7_9FABA|nr:hypothetical protein [Stylosanthes scabra]
MPCVHGIAAIRKKHGNPKDFVHKWLCMESIYATYKYHIHPVPNESYWSNTNYLKTEAPFIKRPIGRPKLHSRKRDPVEDLMQGKSPQSNVTSMRGKAPFRPPARIQNNATKSTNFRVKQPIWRRATRKSPPSSDPAPPSQVAPQSI